MIATNAGNTYYEKDPNTGAEGFLKKFEEAKKEEAIRRRSVIAILIAVAVLVLAALG